MKLLADVISRMEVFTILILGILAFLLLWKMLSKSVESGAVVQAITDQVIEHILGNSQILIILILGIGLFLSMWYYGPSEKGIAFAGNIVSGLLGMAMGQALAKKNQNGGIVP